MAVGDKSADDRCGKDLKSRELVWSSHSHTKCCMQVGGKCDKRESGNDTRGGLTFL